MNCSCIGEEPTIRHLNQDFVYHASLPETCLLEDYIQTSAYLDGYLLTIVS